MCYAAIPAVISAVAGVASAASAQKQASYNRKLAEQQSESLEQEAENVRIAGSQEAGRQQIESEKRLARGRAEMGARGISSAVGTPGDLASDVAEVGAMEQMTILNNASRQAFGMGQQGAALTERAAMDVRAARQRMGATILSSGAKAYSAYSMG